MADIGMEAWRQGMFPPPSHLVDEEKFGVRDFYGHQKRLLQRSNPAELLNCVKELCDERLYCDLVFVCGRIDQGFNRCEIIAKWRILHSMTRILLNLMHKK